MLREEKLVDNVIDAKTKGKSTKITVREIKAQPELAPDISLFHHDEFCQKSLDLIENKLIETGIVIPRKRLAELSSILPDIGKLYYAYVTLKLF